MRNFTVVVGYAGNISEPSKPVTDFRVYVDNALAAAQPANLMAGGQLSIPVNAPAGVHVVQVSAVGPGGETYSDSVTVSLPFFPPDKPTIVSVTVA